MTFVVAFAWSWTCWLMAPAIEAQAALAAGSVRQFALLLGLLAIRLLAVPTVMPGRAGP